MFNFYDFVKDNLTFRQFHVDSLLFTVYDCFIEESPLDYWTRKNYFCFTMKGRLMWKTPKQDYFVNEGDAIFIKKGAHRVYKVMAGGEYCALIIFVPDEFITATIQNRLSNIHFSGNSNDTDGVVPLVLDPILSIYFQSVLNYFSMISPPSVSLLKIKFEELILAILNSDCNQALCNYFQELSCEQKKSITSLVEDNALYNLKISELAELSCRSLASFKRDFKKIYREPPGKWLRNHRLQYARFLLETTDLNINEVTFESGFENTSHFIKIFKDKFKLPPLHYKKQLEASH
jgi:AraC-like DNA-binding protein